jgi:hypothetical protein
MFVKRKNLRLDFERGICMLDILFFGGIVVFYVLLNYFSKWCEKQVNNSIN